MIHLGTFLNQVSTVPAVITSFVIGAVFEVMRFVVAAKPRAVSWGSGPDCAGVLLLCRSLLLRGLLVPNVERYRRHRCWGPWWWGSHRVAGVSEGCLLLGRTKCLGWRHGAVLVRGYSTLLRVGSPLLSCRRVECSPLLSTLLCRLLLYPLVWAVPGLVSLLPTGVALCVSLPLLTTLVHLILH